MHADRISWSEMSIGRPVITPLLWVSESAYSVSTDHCPKCEIVFSFLALGGGMALNSDALLVVFGDIFYEVMSN